MSRKACLPALLTVATFGPFLSVAQTNVNVRPSSLSGWNLWCSCWDESLPTSNAFLGVATLPTGGTEPALWMLTGSGSPHNSMAGAAWNGAPGPAIDTHLLSALKMLSYNTYVDKGSQLATVADKTFAPYAVLSLAKSGTGQTTTYLSYEPRFNGTLIAGTWQTWNAATGSWWSTDYGTGKLGSLAAWLKVYPNARINSLAVEVGAGADYSYWNYKTCATSFLEVQFNGETFYKFLFTAL